MSNSSSHHPRPILELTFRGITNSPWTGEAVPVFQGEPGKPFSVRESLTRKQLEDLRWYIEDYMEFPEGGNEVRARRIEHELVAHGNVLWDSLQGPELQSWLGTVQALGRGRLELRAADVKDEVAYRQPWELMRVGGGTLLHQLGVTVVRRCKANLPGIRSADTGTGLRVLAVICRPDEAGFIDPRYTPEAILDALEGRPEVSVDFCRPGTLAALVEQLQVAQDANLPYHVVHFDGHGTTIPHEGGIGALCFEKADGSLDLVRATQFGDLMARFRIAVVVLEACRSAMKVFAQETVAGSLLRQGVDSVLAMGYVVHVDMTRDLMSGFYGCIARGQSIGEAVQAARNKIYANKHRRMRIVPDSPTVELSDWFVPQLYQRGEDPILLSSTPTKSKTKAKPKALFEGFLNAPRAGFHGRGYEIHRLERAMGRNRIVVIHAAGGMGKTALSREVAFWWVRTGMFPDGAIFISLEGSPSPTAMHVKVGEALDGIQFHQRKNGQDWVRDQLLKKRMLLVWDNYESVLPAFNGGIPTPPEFAQLAEEWTAGNSRLLVTCRDHEVGLSFNGTPAWAFPLGELSMSEGLQLLVGFLERLGIDHSERRKREWSMEMLTRVVKESAGHPLTLELLAPQVAKRGPETVAEEFAEFLSTATQDAPEDRNRNIRASLEYSVRHLSEQAREILPALGMVAGGVPEDVACSIVGLKEEQWVTVRNELQRLGLLRFDGLYVRPHPVLGDIAHLIPTEDQRLKFLASMYQFCELFDQLMGTDKTKVALALMGNSEVVVRRGIEIALTIDEAGAAFDMAFSLDRYYSHQGRQREGAALFKTIQGQTGSRSKEFTRLNARLEMETATDLAAEDADAAIERLQKLLQRLRETKGWLTTASQADVLLNIARVYIVRKGDAVRSLEHLQAAKALYEQAEREGQSSQTRSLLSELAHAFMDLGRYDDARDAALQSLDLARKRGDVVSEVGGLHRVGETFLLQRRLNEAEEIFLEALKVAEQSGGREHLGLIWQKLGIIADYRGLHAASVEYFQKAYRALQDTDDEQRTRQIVNSLGIVEMNRGEFVSAMAWFDKSLEIARKYRDTSGQAHTHLNRGVLLGRESDKTGDPASRESLLNQAVAEGRSALGFALKLDRPQLLWSVHSNLSAWLKELGSLDAAEHHARQALSLVEVVGEPGVSIVLKLLESIATKRGDEEAAADFRHQRQSLDQPEPEDDPGLPLQALTQLLQLALFARVRGETLERALEAVGADDDVITTLDKNEPALTIHLRAMASRQPRPAVPVPSAYADFVNKAWEAAS